MATTKVTLVSSNMEFAELQSSIKAGIFGEMVKRIAPIKHYHSDLYHDACWIERHVRGEMTFHWLVRECGTCIGADAIYYGNMNSGDNSWVMFEVAITNERGKWSASFTEILHDKVPDPDSIPNYRYAENNVQ